MLRMFFTLLVVLGLMASPVLADQCALGHEAVCAAFDHQDTNGNDNEHVQHAGCCHGMQAERIAPSSFDISLTAYTTSIPRHPDGLIPQAELAPLLEPPSHA